MEKTKQELIDFSNRRSTNHFSNYENYIDYQIKKGKSFEKDNEIWSNGQKKCVGEKFKDMDKNIKILDICCGDGRGLLKMREMGFTNIYGVEICDEKINFAKQYGNVTKMDICCGPFDFEDKFDIIYSSHTLEHVLNPEYSIKNIIKYLKDDGIFFLILPYPDIDASNPDIDFRFKIHCGVMPLGLHIDDKGKTTCDIIKKMGLNIINCEFYSYREPEIHLTLKKIV